MKHEEDDFDWEDDVFYSVPEACPRCQNAKRELDHPCPRELDKNINCDYDCNCCAECTEACAK